MKNIFLVTILLLTSFYKTSAQCSTVPVKEAVRNGDFELGYLPSATKINSRTNSHDFTPGGPLDFNSDLQYMGEWNGAGSSCNYSMGDAYGVGRVENPACSPGGSAAVVYGQYGGATTYKDHTTGTKDGFALIVDFNSSSGGAYKTVWSQNVDVYPNQVYYFSAWFAKYGANTTPTLRFRVVSFDAGGTQIEDQVVGSAGPTQAWNYDQFLGSYNTPPNAATAQLYIECISTGQSNSEDFFVDDISFINSCQNIASQISYTLQFDEDTVNLCELGGSYTAVVKNNSGATVSPAGKTVTWFEGSGGTQTEVTAWAGQTSVNITQTGEYRVCIMDAANNGCSVNATIIAKEEFPLAIPDIVLCSPPTVDLDAGVDIPNGAMTSITWSGPSGTDNDRYYTVNAAGQHNVTVVGAGGGGCSANIDFNVTSNLPDVPTNLRYCSGGGVETNLVVGDGVSYSWSPNSDMSSPIGTGVSVPWTPAGGTTGDQTLYIQNSSTTPLGTIVNQATSWEGPGAAQTITVTKTVLLKSVRVTFPGWASGSAKSLTLAGSPYNFTAAGATTVTVDKLLTPGTYSISIAGNINHVPNPSGSIAGYVSVTGGATGAFNNFVFEESAACDPVPVIVKDSVCCTQLPPTVSGADTVCVDGSVTLTATPDGGTSGPITYQWYSDAGLIPGATGSTYNVPAGVAIASTEFWATVTSSASCSGESPISNKIRVMVNPKPTTPTITVNPSQTTFCENEAHDLTAASTVSSGSVTYTWSNAVAGTGATINGVVTPSGSYTYKVVADASGCKDSLEQVITVNPLDSAELTVDTISSCSNQGDIDLNAYKTAGTSAGSFAGTSVTGTNFSTVIAAGVYKVVYTTSGSCPEKDSLYVRIVDQEEAQIDMGDTTVCFGSGSFPIRLTGTSVTDGTWSGTGVTAGTFDPSGLAADVYTVKYVKNGLSASCSDSDSVRITVQALDSALISKPLPSLCNSDPSVQLNLGSGATPGGTWTDSLSANTYVDAAGLFNPSGLADGQYKVIYTTPNTCVAKDSGFVTVTSNIEYTVQGSQQTTYCRNYGLDTLDVDVAGGEIWTKSGKGVVNKDARIFNTSLMDVGIDTLWYGKQGTCGDTIAYEITINPIDTAVIDTIFPLCEDTTVINLSITGSGTGGTWAGTGVSGNQFTASTAGVGVHRITYTTAGSCPIVDTTWIEVKERKDATISADTTAFCGSAIAATMSSAQGGGTWSGWTGKWSTQGSDTLILFDPNANANSGTEDMIYTIADQWCPDADTVSVSITAMEEAEIDTIFAVCVDGDSVQFTLTGASTPGGTWEGTGINPSTGFFNPALAGAGTHEIKYQTPGGCFARDSLSIQVNPRAVTDLDQTLIMGICEGAAVQTVTGTDAGGVWRALGTSSIGTYATGSDKVLSFDPSSSQAGIFTFSYSIDASGSVCGDTDTVAINITAIDTAEITGKGLFCQSDGAGPMTLSSNSTSGGTWSGTGVDPTTGVFNPTAPGVTTGVSTNRVIYTTNGTCPVADTIDVAVVAQVIIDIDLTQSDTAFCGNETGKFVRLTGASTPSQSSVWVSNPLGFVDGSSGEIDVTGAVAAGHSSLDISYVVDAGGTCKDGDTVTVTIKPVPTATITGAPSSNLCKYDGDYTGFSTTGTTGGTWSIDGGGVIDGSTGVVDISAANGAITTYNVTYSVTVDGCSATSTPLSLTVEDSVNSGISGPLPFAYCSNLEAQLISAYQDGGIWTTTATTPGVLQAGSTSKDVLFNPVLAGEGNYTLTYTQNQTCVTSSTAEVLVQGVPTISLDTIVDQYCEPAEVAFIDASSSEATISVWSFSDGTSQTVLDTAKKTLMGGCYDVTLNQQFANGCEHEETFSSFICIDAMPSPDFEWLPSRPSVLDPNVSFQNLSEGASEYLWNFGRIATPTSSSATNPYVQFDSENGDTVTVCLTAINGYCPADTCKDVVILNNVSIFIPTSFTPNGDGLNDFFYPNGKFHDNSEGLDQFEFVIFNRWGERIFNSNVPYKPWDGTYRNKIVPQDVYVWKITVWDPVHQRPKTEIGTVTVVH